MTNRPDDKVTAANLAHTNIRAQQPNATETGPYAAGRSRSHNAVGKGNTMFDPTPDFRHQLAAERTAALQGSAERFAAQDFKTCAVV